MVHNGYSRNWALQFNFEEVFVEFANLEWHYSRYTKFTFDLKLFHRMMGV